MRFIPAVSPVRIQVPLPNKGAAIFTAPFIWPVGQAVKTPPFHGGNMGSIPVRVTSSSQATYRLRRAFLFHYKAHLALTLLLLASKSNPLRWASIWFFCEASSILIISRPCRSKVRFAPTPFYAYGKKGIIRPLPCSSFSQKSALKSPVRL